MERSRCGIVTGALARQQAKQAREREAVQLMRSLKVAEEEAHGIARRWETVRPEKARVLFDLSRQAFQLHQAM